MAPPHLAAAAVSLFALLIRYAVSLHPHSGMGAPPMHGDFEAQRHWLEVTIALPPQAWYWYDLPYWGLDYPPLTAYHSWVLGKAARDLRLAPELVAFEASRGHEGARGVLFMRLSVLLGDALVLLPAVWAFARDHYGNGNAGKGAARRGSNDGGGATRRRVREVALLALLQPALVLIDHGHFQYNGLALGLVAWCAVALGRGRDCVGSVLFCLALNFKQMTLYFAPAVFCHLLARCAQRARGGEARGAAGRGGRIRWAVFVLHVAKLGAVVIATFAALWWPFCVYSGGGAGAGTGGGTGVGGGVGGVFARWSSRGRAAALGGEGVTCAGGLAQVLHRLFPFARGLFEDKVANVWCVGERSQNALQNIDCRCISSQLMARGSHGRAVLR